MINLKFQDYCNQKYTYTGTFKEGLARVKNQQGLWGYINKKGIEVIPCQFENAQDFSEGLAIIRNKEGLAGYIDKNGQIVIECQYIDAYDFHEGIAAVRIGEKQWKYINQVGEYIIDKTFEQADNFSEGYAIVKTAYSPLWTYIDSTGKTYGQYKYANRFSEGLAIVGSNSAIEVINKSFEVIKRIERYNLSIPEEYSDGLALATQDGIFYGYLDKDLNKRIPFMFAKAQKFRDGVATVKLSPYFLGIINEEGKILTFYQYSSIKSFSEGLSAIKNDKKLWGYINKEGEEIIPCQYKEADDFSEGLAAVIDTNGIFHYIDKHGNKKITIGDIHYSMLELDDKTIYIVADGEEELKTKKLQVLEVAKQEIVEKTINTIDQLAYDTTAGLYPQSKSKVKKPPRQKPVVGIQSE